MGGTRDQAPEGRSFGAVKREAAHLSKQSLCKTVTTAAKNNDLPVGFFIRLIWQESRFDPNAVSPVGAQGVAQFMPATAAAVGLDDPFDPIQALRASARLLRDLISQFGNLGLAAAAYNAGPKRIFDWLARRDKLPNETRHYVRSITGHDAERWRVTRPGKLAFSVPKQAPCQGLSVMAKVTEVPVPVPLPKPRSAAVKKPPVKVRRQPVVASGKDKAVADSSAHPGRAHGRKDRRRS